VGCTPPSIYLHFTDKKDLLFEVVEQQFDKLDRYVLAATEESDDPLEVLRLQGRAYVQFGLENPEHYRLLFMGPDLKPPDPERILKLSCFGRVVHTVERCMEAGRFRPDDPFTVACALWTMLHGLTSLLISKPGFPWPDDDLFERLVGMLVRGLAEPG
jgi:AcrR family transcriptional regulator